MNISRVLRFSAGILLLLHVTVFVSADEIDRACEAACSADSGDCLQCNK